MRKIRLGIVAAMTIGAGVFAVAAPATAAAPASIEVCTYTFNGAGVYIRTSAPSGTPVGEGQKGQSFVSSPAKSEVAGGKTWIYGTDTATNKTGWVAQQYLNYVSCHVYND